MCWSSEDSEDSAALRIVCRRRGDFWRTGGGSDEPVFEGVRRAAAKDPAIIAEVNESKLRLEDDTACEGLRLDNVSLVGEWFDLAVDCLLIACRGEL
jgi:hypothetical protein